jgi:hypothetical protein
MTKFICDNPECSYHLELDRTSQPPVVQVWIPVNSGGLNAGYFETVHRHLYRRLKSLEYGVAESEDTYLCHVCHAAVQLIKKPGIFDAKRAKT